MEYARNMADVTLTYLGGRVASFLPPNCFLHHTSQYQYESPQTLHSSYLGLYLPWRPCINPPHYGVRSEWRTVCVPLGLPAVLR